MGCHVHRNYKSSMLMPMRAMHMAVGNFFCRGGAHIRHGAAETQRLPRQLVVAIEVHFGAFDLHHVEHARLAVIASALQLATHFHAGWKF